MVQYNDTVTKSVESIAVFDAQTYKIEYVFVQIYKRSFHVFMAEKP